MDHRDEKAEKSLPWQKRQLILALLTSVLLAVVMGALAWLNYTRGLQTTAMLQMPILFLQDKNGVDTVSVDIGNTDVSSSGKKVYLFGVRATASTEYILQLAHTTNIDLQYNIYYAQTLQEAGWTQVDNLYVNYSAPLDGAYLTNDRDQTPNTYDETYKTGAGNVYEHVQDQANPRYWQAANPKSIIADNVDFYALEITWGGNLTNNKESDMIYLTVATARDSITNSVGGGQ